MDSRPVVRPRYKSVLLCQLGARQFSRHERHRHLQYVAERARYTPINIAELRTQDGERVARRRQHHRAERTHAHRKHVALPEYLLRLHGPLVPRVSLVLAVEEHVDVRPSPRHVDVTAGRAREELPRLPVREIVVANIQHEVWFECAKHAAYSFFLDAQEADVNVVIPWNHVMVPHRANQRPADHEIGQVVGLHLAHERAQCRHHGDALRRRYDALEVRKMALPAGMEDGGQYE